MSIFHTVLSLYPSRIDTSNSVSLENLIKNLKSKVGVTLMPSFIPIKLSSLWDFKNRWQSWERKYAHGSKIEKYSAMKICV